LQNWRSTVIPLIAVPVAIIGTFAVMAAIGFSLNNLNALRLVLAIGIVVDDAIVVVEAVEHHRGGDGAVRRHGQGDEQVSGPVVAVALVLSAVFVPCAFISGIVGQFFRQFALTIAVSTLISAFNSLTLSPALAAICSAEGGEARPVSADCSTCCSAGSSACSTAPSAPHGRLHADRAPGPARQRRGAGAVRRPAGLCGWVQPAADRFIPPQDKGYLLVAVQTRTRRRWSAPTTWSGTWTRSAPKLRAWPPHLDGRAVVLAGAYGSNFGQMFRAAEGVQRAPLAGAVQPTHHRQDQGARLEKEVPDAVVQVLGPPAVSGWAPPAASSSSSRTAATSAWRSCRSRPTT